MTGWSRHIRISLVLVAPVVWASGCRFGYEGHADRGASGAGRGFADNAGNAGSGANGSPPGGRSGQGGNQAGESQGGNATSIAGGGGQSAGGGGRAGSAAGAGALREAPDCGTEVLEARKEYNPSTWFPDGVRFDKPVTLTVPERIEVTAGNAGNHWLKLFYFVAEGRFTCWYQGGADRANPTGNQVEKGQAYEFVHCERADELDAECGELPDNPTPEAPPERPAARSIELNVCNGAPGFGTTRVRLPLDLGKCGG